MRVQSTDVQVFTLRFISVFSHYMAQHCVTWFSSAQPTPPLYSTAKISEGFTYVCKCIYFVISFIDNCIQRNLVMLSTLF